ncbi:MAG: hypothetical protein PHI86_01260 [Candidatus Omnitrophica bacterium]|nr:hypothetical protein [Candidatus Omnitrophota bacterium]HOX53926.1 hypothetical protein [Candidatus Omnitrophota bacterium]
MKKLASILVLVSLILISQPLFAENIYNFKGDLDFLKHIFSLEMNFKEKSILKTNVSFDDDKLFIEAKIQNFKFNGHIFSTEISGQGGFVEQDGVRVLKCDLESKYSLMDYKPFDNFLANFTLTKDSLSISKLSWGNSNIIGEISLVGSKEINLYAEIKDADINQLTALLGLKQEDLALSGTADGFLRFKGPAANLRINGQLRAKDGIAQGISYREITVGLEGIYPIVNLHDCEIIEQDGTVYAFDGKLNLNEVNNLYSSENSFSFFPLTNSDDLSLRKWTIRREKERGNLELEKSFKSGRPENLRLKDDSSFDMLGVEQTLKF